jgi:hypothetical protein
VLDYLDTHFLGMRKRGYEQTRSGGRGVTERPSRAKEIID